MNSLLSDTGRASFYLYLFSIFIGLLSVFLVYRLVKKENIEQDKLEKFLDYFKWTLGTLAVSTVTLIISNLFKEREQDIKELEYFDKYVNDVKNEREPLVRLQLVKYLSIVAPEGSMRMSWVSYCDTLRKQYQAYLAKEKKEAKEKLEEIAKQIKEGKGIPDSEIDEQKRRIEQSQEEEGNVFPVPLSSSTRDWKEAEEFELEGFHFLINKNIDEAIRAFTKSENAYPGYHSVYEIGRYLKDHEESLSDKNAEQWKFTYNSLVKEAKYNWKMPKEYKRQFIELSK